MNTEYPNDADGQALERVAADGNDMSKEMDIDFHIAVPDQATGQQVADKAQMIGYRTELFFDDDVPENEDEPIAQWTCECTKTMLPEYHAIVESQKELAEIAGSLGAFVDGWGTFGNTGDSM